MLNAVDVQFNLKQNIKLKNEPCSVFPPRDGAEVF